MSENGSYRHRRSRRCWSLSCRARRNCPQRSDPWASAFFSLAGLPAGRPHHHSVPQADDAAASDGGIAPLLQELFAQIPPPVPRLHPRPSDVYRATVTNLHVALNDPEARTEVAADRPAIADPVGAEFAAVARQGSGRLAVLAAEASAARGNSGVCLG